MAGSTVLDEPLRAMLSGLLEMLRMRHHTRASAWRTVHVVWDLPEPMPSETVEELVFLCREANFKFVAIARDKGFLQDDDRVVMIGVGGVLAEIYGDVAIRLAPIDAAMALEMIDEVKGLAPIRGYRGMKEGDCAALANAVSRLSTLALVPGTPVSEAEINPMIVRAKGNGVVAVDGLVSLKSD